jgi:hypothetical protein
MSGATIEIFLVHGDPKRLRTAKLRNWTIQAVAGPRSEVEGVLDRVESERSGVYFLTGNDPESGKPALYVGEAENIRDRAKAHLEKDFWNQIVHFTSNDDNLTKAHIRYLEGKLIEQARLANRALVMNGQRSGAKLPESDREDMEVFLEKIYQLLPVLGVDLLVTIAGKATTDAEKEMLYCEIKGLKAKGRLTPTGFLVLKGSQAVLKERASSHKFPWPLNMRQRLKDEGVLSVSEDYLVFNRDEEFSSPSAAAAVVHGGHANGLISWKNRNGKTLKEIESI